MTPGREMVEAFLAENIRDVRRPGSALKSMGLPNTAENRKRLRDLAVAWFEARRPEPFGFQWTCDVLDLDADAVLRELKL